MTYKGHNIGHWVADPLEDDMLEVLRRVKAGSQQFTRDRFQVAYLISRECIEADLDNQTLKINTKGLDALDFFGDET